MIVRETAVAISDSDSKCSWKWSQ